MKPDAVDACVWSQELPALLLGELAAARAAEVERHLAGCAACAARRDEFGRVLLRLRALPAESPARDLAPEILARLDQEAPITWHRLPAGVLGSDRLEACSTFFRRQPIWLRAAAVLLALFGIGGVLAWRAHRATVFDLAATVPAVRHPCPEISNPYPAAERTHAIAQAQAWLERTQEADGHWDTAHAGAQRRYTVGLTALSLLALAADDQPPTGALQRGFAWLVAQQDARGQFGPDDSAAMYNHSMATLALLAGAALETNGTHRAACQRALAYIVATQRASGGWGYSRGPSDNVNTSITVWQLQALLRADELGFAGVRTPIARGLAWLGGRVGPAGRVGYRRADDFPNGSETLTAAGALCLLRTPTGARDPRVAQMLALVRGTAAQTTAPDYYRWYFVSAALAAAGAGGEPALHHLRAAVLARQTRVGAEAGSWLPSDRWSHAGGRLYATALAVLALQSG
jgi:hypothetical protein